MRDLANQLGLRVTIEDTWGGDIVTGGCQPSGRQQTGKPVFTASFMNDWVMDHVAGHQPRSKHGVGSAPDGLGLGIEVDVSCLGEPLFSAQN